LALLIPFALTHPAQAAGTTCPAITRESTVDTPVENLDVGNNLFEAQTFHNAICTPSGTVAANATVDNRGTGPLKGDLTTYLWINGQEVDHRALHVDTSATQNVFSVITALHTLPEGQCSTSESKWVPDGGSTVIYHTITFCNTCLPVYVKQVFIQDTHFDIQATLQRRRVKEGSTCQLTDLFFADVTLTPLHPDPRIVGEWRAYLWEDGKVIDHAAYSYSYTRLGDGIGVPARTNNHILSAGHCMNAEEWWFRHIGNTANTTIAKHTESFCL
jgi:hypothetical protein